MAERKKRSWRVWVVLADVGPRQPSEIAHYDDGPIMMVFKDKRVDYLFDGEEMRRATLTLDAPPQPRRKPNKIVVGLKEAIAHASGKRPGKVSKITVRKP